MVCLQVRDLNAIDNLGDLENIDTYYTKSGDTDILSRFKPSRFSSNGRDALHVSSVGSHFLSAGFSTYIFISSTLTVSTRHIPGLVSRSDFFAFVCILVWKCIGHDARFSWARLSSLPR